MTVYLIKKALDPEYDYDTIDLKSAIVISCILMFTCVNEIITAFLFCLIAQKVFFKELLKFSTKIKTSKQQHVIVIFESH